MSTYISLFFQKASDFIDSLPDRDKAKALAAIKSMETDFDSVSTKVLQSPIRELIVKKYRILFFIQENVLYIVSGFVKKSQKAPTQEISYALELYRKYRQMG